MGQVIDLGQWVICSYRLLSIGVSCETMPRRPTLTLGSAIESSFSHEHYVVCGCRWSIDRPARIVRTRRCARHPKRGWEYTVT